LSSLLLNFRTAAALASLAIVVAGCAATNNATSSQGEQPYTTGYGLTSDGPTTDLYTELFGSRKNATAPATTNAAAQQGQSVTSPAAAPLAPQETGSTPTRQAQPATTTASRQSRPPLDTAKQVQPATAVAQEVSQPTAPPEPDVPVAYGITANGPTTDLFTELFGSRRRDGQ